jgi:hypothetical protein
MNIEFGEYHSIETLSAAALLSLMGPNTIASETHNIILGAANFEFNYTALAFS